MQAKRLTTHNKQHQRQSENRIQRSYLNGAKTPRSHELTQVKLIPFSWKNPKYDRCLAPYIQYYTPAQLHANQTNIVYELSP